jgi:5-methylcytosine-specific restriction endonuclease McrA
VSLDKVLRRACFERDDYRCMHCNNRNGIDPHHIVHRSRGGKDELANLVTVCRECHNAHHDGFLKIELLGGRARFTRLGNWRPK